MATGGTSVFRIQDWSASLVSVWVRRTVHVCMVLSTPADFDLLKEPAGNVMFSGEHTCGRFYGFVHGAMLAGARDGQMLLEKLGLPFTPETRCEKAPANQGKKDMPQSKYYKRGGRNRFAK